MSFTCLTYSIRALTNLHVGSGEENYGLIDKLVQRDVLTGLPCIHPSSLKGAIKQYLDHQGMTPETQKAICGSDASINKGESGTGYQSGEYAFLGGHLLALPVAAAQHTYVMVVSPGILAHLADMAAQLGFKWKKDAWTSLKDIKNDKLPMSTDSAEVLDLADFHVTVKRPAEDKKAAFEALAELVGTGPVVLVTDAMLRDLAGDLRLPVIARNSLNDGQSVNLWYEQVLPRQTRMLTFILVPEGDPDVRTFDALVQKQVVQVGGNASVGYGFTRWTAVHSLPQPVSPQPDSQS